MGTIQVSNLVFESTGNNRIQYTNSNSYVMVVGGSNTVSINTSGVFSTVEISALTFNSTSDINKKTDIEPIENSLDIIDQLNGVKFKWKDSNCPSMGVIAQDIQKVLPELVSNEMSVNYSGIIAVLIESIKQLKKEVQDLKNDK